MKGTLVAVVALLLTAGLAWAEPPAGNTASQEEALFASTDGGCELPDLAGLSEEEQEVALEEAGFGVGAQPAAFPTCPTNFNCSSITNCGVGPVCSVTDIGQCCTTGGGLARCCLNGTIKVTRCRCKCTGNPCAILCINSTDVKQHCS